MKTASPARSRCRDSTSPTAGPHCLHLLQSSSNLAHANGGLDKVNTSMQKVLDLLSGVSITIVTTAYHLVRLQDGIRHARFMDVVLKGRRPGGWRCRRNFLLPA